MKAGLAISSLLLVLASCRPKIGDDCTSSLDCSAQGDRLCDTSQPEGYCTIFSCEPDRCPEQASVCVGFGLALAPNCENPDAADPSWPRFERTFCLAPCDTDDDCREGYRCAAPEERGAASIDVESEIKDSKVCFVASEAPVVDPAATCRDSN